MRVSKAQRSALRWLKTNGGLSVPNMNTAGKAREWPQTRTLRALVTKGLADFEQGAAEWTVRVNAAGAALAESE